MSKKNVFNQPGAVRFQLVHRSQRDPLIHDADASQNIFKPIPGKKSGGEYDGILGSEYGTSDKRKLNESDAAQYGVYFDDSEYDYLQHLRPIGEKEDNVESVLIELPSTSKPKPNVMTLRETADVSANDIPSEYLPPSTELPRDLEAQRNIPSAIAGFRPDMNPHLRQTLEALEDEAFVENNLDDDFFRDLVVDGVIGGEDELDFPFDDGGLADSMDESLGNPTPHNCETEGWEERFKRFKSSQTAELGKAPASDRDFIASEGGDTIGTLPQMSVLGIRKRRRKAGSDASGYTMSSGSMYRNEGLSLLDERFDQIYEKEYENEHDLDCDCSECEDPSKHRSSSDDDSEPPDLIAARDDFEGIMNDFLGKYEIVGTQLKQVLEGKTGADKLDTLRKAMAGASLEDEKDMVDTIKRLVKMQEDSTRKIMDTEIVSEASDDNKERWDCETILTTYSNLENHPRVIRARDAKARSVIALDPVTGLPIDGKGGLKGRIVAPVEVDQRVNRNALTRQTGPQLAVSRSKNETKEEKAARKQAVKADKQVRRADKKMLKEAFIGEKKSQIREQVGRQIGGVGLKKL